MSKNEFKAFATADNANIMPQAEWESLPALLSGFVAGKASSAQVNKALRQASFIAAALAQYTANKSGLDVLDDGDLNGFVTKMTAAFGKDFQALDATLTALAGLATGANKLPYFNGEDTAALTDLTSVGRDIIGKNNISDILTYLGLEHFGYEPSTGETAIFNGNKNLRYFINNNNESGVASVDFGLLWGFDGAGKLVKGIIPVGRLDGLSGNTGSSTTAVMHQKATTDAINGVKTTVVQSVGTSTTSVMSQNAVTSLVNDAASVGVNQLWNDVTASRSVGVNYTNNTGRPIIVAMSIANVAINTLASSLTVQGILMTTGSPISGEHRYISAIVPPGQTYKFTPVASVGFTLWELRA